MPNVEYAENGTILFVGHIIGTWCYDDGEWTFWINDRLVCRTDLPHPECVVE